MLAYMAEKYSSPDMAMDRELKFAPVSAAMMEAAEPEPFSSTKMARMS